MMSPSPSTSVSEPGSERGSASALLLSLWAVSALVTLCRAEDLRDWVLESDHAGWASSAADGLVEVADVAGIAVLRSQTEAVRASLYGVQTAAPTPAPPPPSAAATEPEPSAAVSVPAHEIAPLPKRVLLVGASSMQFAIGQALEKQLAAFEGLEVRRVGKASTGLSRPDGFNWPARIEELLDESKPDLVIVNFGGNDAQNIPLPNRQRAEFGSDAWDRVYGERVTNFVMRIRARGAQAVLIGMPIMRSPDFTKRMARLNAVTETATLAAGGIFLDQWDLAATASGEYRERIEERGKSLPMRLEDGIHYTEPGGRYVVARLIPRLERVVRLVPKDATLGVMERHSFTSAALGKRTSYLAWLPRVAAGERVPLLILLHGADASPDVIAEHLSAALASGAQQHRIAIVAPDGANGWWLDSPEHATSRYASLVASDLLADARANLPVNDAVGITGISMGGHGALTLAFEHRDVFRSASSVSGVVDLTRAHDRAALIALLGPLDQRGARWDAHSALQQLEKRGRGLALRISCGANDRWIETNRALHERATQLQFAHDYDEAPAGHEWSYWQAIVPEHVAWHAARLTAAK